MTGSPPVVAAVGSDPPAPLPSGSILSAHGFGTLVLSLAALALIGCGKGDAGTAPRAVVIGIDGADWKVIESLAAEGELPNLTGLRERGTWGPIETLHDIALSPVIWTSVATGKTPAKHGITWFLVDQPDGTRVPVRSTNRRTRAIWNILNDNGRVPAVVGWWATYPAEDVGRGTIVSDALGFHGFGATARGGDDGAKTHPPGRFPELDALVPPEHQLPYAFLSRFVRIGAAEYRAERFDPARFPRHDPSNPIHLFQQYAVTAQGYTRIAEKLLEERPYDLFMVYFEQVDSFSHLFMKHAPPRLPWVDQEEFERYQDVVREWYRYQDELLGRILRRIDLETTAVFVLSDHGFKSGQRRIRSEEVVDARKAHLDHETHGIFVAAGPHVRRGARLAEASVLDLTPTLLYYLGLPVGKDMDGKVLLDVFDPRFRESRPIRYVSTHEARERPGVTPSPVWNAGDADEARAVEEQLAALGYTGDETDDETPEAPAESSPEIHNNLGRIHLRNGETEEALEQFELGLGLDPANAEALLNIGTIHHIQGKTELARHFVDRALAVDPSSIGALARLGEIHRDEGDLDEAIRLFTEALEIDDSHPFLFQGIGDVLQRAGFYEQAVQAFQRVLELEPDSFKARYNLGVTYTNMDRVDEAVAVYDEALALEPDHLEAPAVHNNLGAIFLARGDEERALSSFEAAYEAAPYHVESRHNAALVHLKRGNEEEAIELLEQAAELDPSHEQVNLRLGMTYLDAGRGQDAFRRLLLVRRLHPENWTAAVGLAALHAEAGRPEEAERLLREAVGHGGDAANGLAALFPALEAVLD